MRYALLGLLTGLALAAPALAQKQKADDHSAHQHPPAKAAAASADTTDAEVRKVDKDSAKLTLKHGEIKNLEMPAMTMVFAVKDKAVLDKLKAGDKVRFKALSEGGRLIAADIQLLP